MIMHNQGYIGAAGESLLPFGLFIGAALSVTAFPVMAHILMGRGELNTPLGSLAVATAGIMSIFMFTYIAFAQAVAQASGLGSFARQVGFIVLFGAVTRFVAQPIARRWLPRYLGPDAQLTGNAMGFVFGGMVLYGMVAHIIGINALVGGFAWGITMPENKEMRAVLATKVRDVAPLAADLLRHGRLLGRSQAAHAKHLAGRPTVCPGRRCLEVSGGRAGPGHGPDLARDRRVGRAGEYARLARSGRRPHRAAI
jgi:hypothetical protein